MQSSAGHLHQSIFYWQRILRNEAYIEQKQVLATGESNLDLHATFAELRLISSEKPCFQPDMIMHIWGIVVELINMLSPELPKQIGGIR